MRLLTIRNKFSIRATQAVSTLLHQAHFKSDRVRQKVPALSPDSNIILSTLSFRGWFWPLKVDMAEPLYGCPWANLCPRRFPWLKRVKPCHLPVSESTTYIYEYRETPQRGSRGKRRYLPLFPAVGNSWVRCIPPVVEN